MSLQLNLRINEIKICKHLKTNTLSLKFYSFLDIEKEDCTTVHY